VYIKRFVTLSAPHTELAYSSAFNFMRFDSNGAALWIAFFYKDLLKHYTADQARAMMVKK
jgi:hypothetical protein